MKKTVILSMILALSQTCYADGLKFVSDIKGAAPHTLQVGWLIADEITSAGTKPSALDKDDERTYRQVVALIAAESSGDDEISIFPIPKGWNGMKFRSINITKDSGTATHQIYFGTLGGNTDCDLTYAAQLAWTSGDQDSMYHQIAFTSGGTYEPKPDNTVTGNTSGKTAVVVSTTLSSGTWAGGDAAGTITYRSEDGTFTNSETVKITDYLGVTQADVLTHAASDLVQFEYADTLTVTSKAWGSTWHWFTPADDTLAEAKVDVDGADVMIVVTSVCTADSKLLVKGY